MGTVQDLTRYFFKGGLHIGLKSGNLEIGDHSSFFNYIFVQ